MKQIFVAMTFLFIAVSSFAQAATEEAEPVNFVELVHYRGVHPVAVFYFEKEVGNDLVLYINGATTRGLNEFAVGPAYYITPEMEVGFSLGVSQYASDTEDVASSHRLLSSFFYWKTEKVETSVAVQNYASDPKPWYGKAYAQYKITDNLSAGAYAETGVGIGPRVSYAFSKNVNAWAVPLINKSGNNTLVAGVQFLF